jgi:DNA-binding response OmpR family regulator
MSAPKTGARRVLIIEDDESITLGLSINLRGEGYEVFSADNGETGLELARSERPDLVILDVMLPRMNGLEVLQEARKDGLQMPIIMLSARTAEMDKVAGLELGAEDYVAKPFSLAELLARVRAALRRGPPVPAPPPAPVARPVDTFGEVTVDRAARTVSRGGAPVEMTATEFDLLTCLIDAKGVALEREEIFARVWGPNHHGTQRTIDNFVQRLRAKLESDPQRPRYLQTVRGVGYRFDG